MKTALVTGICGQDGVYLARLLAGLHYRIVGLVRPGRSLTPDDIVALPDNVELLEWDMRGQDQIEKILARAGPDEFYNIAAYSSGAGMFDSPVELAEVNGLAVTRILEAIRSVNPSIRFAQASSSEMFGETSVSPQDERSPFAPRNPYGAAKLYAHTMIGIYRNRYGLFACSAILFNHESPRRGFEFVTRKIARAAAEAKLGLPQGVALGNFSARRDWGFAGDYVEAMWRMLQAPSADDYVVATGETHSVGEFCDVAFAHVGLDYRQFVSEDPSSFRPNEAVELVGDASKAERELGWRPRISFSELVSMLVDAELEQLSANGVLG